MEDHLGPSQGSESLRNHIIAAISKPSGLRTYDDLLLIKSYMLETEFFEKCQLGNANPRHVNDLCRGIELEEHKGHDVVFNQGDFGNKVYIILFGKVEFIARFKIDLTQGQTEIREKKLDTFLAGQIFGERALHFEEARSATAQCVEETYLITVEKSVYLRVFEDVRQDRASNFRPDQLKADQVTRDTVLTILGKKRERRTHQELEAVALYLCNRTKVESFQKLSMAQVVEVCRVAETLTIWGKNMVCKQGEVGPAFYAVLSGSVEVWVSRDAPTPTPMRSGSRHHDVTEGLGRMENQLVTGKTFGDRALSSMDSLRKASIVTCEDVTILLVIFRKDYENLIAATSQVEAMAKIRLLRRTDLFHNLDMIHLRALANVMETKTYGIDETVVTVGKRAAEVIVIERGELTVVTEVLEGYAKDGYEAMVAQQKYHHYLEDKHKPSHVTADGRPIADNTEDYNHDKLKKMPPKKNEILEMSKLDSQKYMQSKLQRMPSTLTSTATAGHSTTSTQGSQQTATSPNSRENNSNSNNNNNSTSPSNNANKPHSSSEQRRRNPRFQSMQLVPIGRRKKVTLGRIAPNSVLATYVMTTATQHDEVYHPETIVATTLVNAYTISKHAFFTSLPKDSKYAIVRLVKEYKAPLLTSLWENVPRVLDETQWKMEKTWKNFKDRFMEHGHKANILDSHRRMENLHISVNSGNDPEVKLMPRHYQFMNQNKDHGAAGVAMAILDPTKKKQDVTLDWGLSAPKSNPAGASPMSTAAAKAVSEFNASIQASTPTNHHQKQQQQQQQADHTNNQHSTSTTNNNNNPNSTNNPQQMYNNQMQSSSAVIMAPTWSSSVSSLLYAGDNDQQQQQQMANKPEPLVSFRIRERLNLSRSMNALSDKQLSALTASHSETALLRNQSDLPYHSSSSPSQGGGIDAYFEGGDGSASMSMRRQQSGSASAAATTTTNSASGRNGHRKKVKAIEMPFTLIQIHREVTKRNPINLASVQRRPVRSYVRVCGSFPSCAKAKDMADLQMEQHYLQLFHSEASKEEELLLHWHTFSGFDAMALDASDHFFIYCRSTPVEYASLRPSKNIFNVRFPAVCKPQSQRYAILLVNALPMTAAEQINRSKRQQEEDNNYNSNGEDEDSDSSDEDNANNNSGNNNSTSNAGNVLSTLGNIKNKLRRRSKKAKAATTASGGGGVSNSSGGGNAALMNSAATAAQLAAGAQQSFSSAVSNVSNASNNNYNSSNTVNGNASVVSGGGLSSSNLLLGGMNPAAAVSNEEFDRDINSGNNNGNVKSMHFSELSVVQETIAITNSRMEGLRYAIDHFGKVIPARTTVSVNGLAHRMPMMLANSSISSSQESTMLPSFVQSANAAALMAAASGSAVPSSLSSSLLLNSNTNNNEEAMALHAAAIVNAPYDSLDIHQQQLQEMLLATFVASQQMMINQGLDEASSTITKQEHDYFLSQAAVSGKRRLGNRSFVMSPEALHNASVYNPDNLLHAMSNDPNVDQSMALGALTVVLKPLDYGHVSMSGNGQLSSMSSSMLNSVASPLSAVAGGVENVLGGGGNSNSSNNNNNGAATAAAGAVGSGISATASMPGIISSGIAINNANNNMSTTSTTVVAAASVASTTGAPSNLGTNPNGIAASNSSSAITNNYNNSNSSSSNNNTATGLMNMGNNNASNTTALMAAGTASLPLLPSLPGHGTSTSDRVLRLLHHSAMLHPNHPSQRLRVCVLPLFRWILIDGPTLDILDFTKAFHEEAIKNIFLAEQEEFHQQRQQLAMSPHGSRLPSRSAVSSSSSTRLHNSSNSARRKRREQQQQQSGGGGGVDLYGEETNRSLLSTPGNTTMRMHMYGPPPGGAGRNALGRGGHHPYDGVVGRGVGDEEDEDEAVLYMGGAHLEDNSAEVFEYHAGGEIQQTHNPYNNSIKSNLHNNHHNPMMPAHGSQGATVTREINQYRDFTREVIENKDLPPQLLSSMSAAGLLPKKTVKAVAVRFAGGGGSGGDGFGDSSHRMPSSSSSHHSLGQLPSKKKQPVNPFSKSAAAGGGSKMLGHFSSTSSASFASGADGHINHNNASSNSNSGMHGNVVPSQDIQRLQFFQQEIAAQEIGQNLSQLQIKQASTLAPGQLIETDPLINSLIDPAVGDDHNSVFHVAGGQRMSAIDKEIAVTGQQLSQTMQQLQQTIASTGAALSVHDKLCDLEYATHNRFASNTSAVAQQKSLEVLNRRMDVIEGFQKLAVTPSQPAPVTLFSLYQQGQQSGNGTGNSGNNSGNNGTGTSNNSNNNSSAAARRPRGLISAKFTNNAANSNGNNNGNGTSSGQAAAAGTGSSSTLSSNVNVAKRLNETLKVLSESIDGPYRKQQQDIQRSKDLRSIKYGGGLLSSTNTKDGANTQIYTDNNNNNNNNSVASVTTGNNSTTNSVVSGMGSPIPMGQQQQEFAMTQQVSQSSLALSV